MSAAHVEEEDDAMDFSSFEEITSHIENLSSALKVFGAHEITELDPVRGKLPATSVVLYGDKIVVQNLKKVDETKDVKKHAEEYDEEGGADSLSFGSTPLSPGLHTSGTGSGTIVFHIDNTSSMLREKRMVLTKDVLKRVIPNFLRMGFRVVVNAWASTQENKGRIKTREVNLDATLLQVLHSGGNVAKQSKEADGVDVDDFGSAVAAEGVPSGDALIHQYLEEHVFDILAPKGRTDLYGSCFQLMRQCRALLGSSATSPVTVAGSPGAGAGGPVYAFVLTDGEHNLLNAPLHDPKCEGEDYFGVFSSVHSTYKKYFKFERTGVEPTVAMCESFLRRELDTVNGKISAAGDEMLNSASKQQARLTVTFVGIGELQSVRFFSYTFCR